MSLTLALAAGLSTLVLAQSSDPKPPAPPSPGRERAARYMSPELRVGGRLQDFSFTDFEGSARKLSDFRGKYLLIDIWGSWCKPCVQDLPLLKAAHDRFAGPKFEILGIDYENTWDEETLRALMKEKDVSWPNATPASVKELVREKWRIMAFPTLILLDPDGVILETSSSALRGKNLIPTLERVLQK